VGGPFRQIMVQSVRSSGNLEGRPVELGITGYVVWMKAYRLTSQLTR